MGWGAAIGGIAMGVGAGVGGALSGGGGSTPGATREEATGLDTSPGLKIAEFNNMLQMGIYDPSRLYQASPVNQLLAEGLSSNAFGNGQKNAILYNIRVAMEWYEAGQPMYKPGKKQIYANLSHGVNQKGAFRGVPIDSLKGVLNRMYALSGFSSLDELFAAESAFKAQIEPLLEDAKASAAGNWRAGLAVQDQIRNLITNLPDASAGGISKLRGEEKERLLRNLNMNVDERRGDLLELANSGNFNPGRPLGDLEEFRARSTQDADMEALARALALIGGQQSVAGTSLNMLYGRQTHDFNQAQGLAQADQGFRASGMMSQPNLNDPGNTGLAQGIAAGIGNIGKGIGDGIYAYNNRPNQTPPAWDQPSVLQNH